ncbi:hypothetical protein KEM60_02163 [Austwickia sp. TVS 96-490-7B]|uniref:hypothetical protein n=1 Tax=Austwickia sp. TVS 96-490-7B TaxID=2830843 RepID=UPI001C5842CA|nr:hypothetical protein [Austwickia sp. TVS 96-490-7B]MBW3085952.1 hypothetical protein [Austwickia sp. TVS 96-490-7B]
MIPATPPPVSYVVNPSPSPVENSGLSELQQMQARMLIEQYGLEPDVAVVRVKQQDEHSKTDQRARQVLGKAYAGSHIDQKRGVLTIFTTDEKTAEQLRGDGTEVKAVARSQEKLDELQQLALDKLGERFRSARVDTEHNSVIIGVDPADLDAATEAIEDLDGVEIEADSATVQQQSTTLG